MSGATRFFNAKKGGNNMECNHGRIKSVNCRLFCEICGEELPAEYLTGKRPQAAEQAENGQKTPKKTTRKRKA